MGSTKASFAMSVVIPFTSQGRCEDGAAARALDHVLSTGRRYFGADPGSPRARTLCGGPSWQLHRPRLPRLDAMLRYARAILCGGAHTAGRARPRHAAG